MTDFYRDMRAVMQEHRNLNEAVAQNANSLADLLEDNLRHISPYRLQRIKKKLAAFNAHTGRWTR